MHAIKRLARNENAKLCSIAVLCGGTNIGKANVKVSVEGIFSDSSTQEGGSASICSTGTFAYRYGLTGSRCRGQDGSLTYSTGVVMGNGIQYSEQACMQYTQCF